MRCHSIAAPVLARPGATAGHRWLTGPVTSSDQPMPTNGQGFCGASLADRPITSLQLSNRTAS